VITVVEFVQGPLSAIFSRAQHCGIDYVHAVITSLSFSINFNNTNITKKYEVSKFI
jgi:hypothetical protein